MKFACPAWLPMICWWFAIGHSVWGQTLPENDEAIVFDQLLQRVAIPELQLELQLQRIEKAPEGEQRNWQLRQFWQLLSEMAPDFDQFISRDWHRYLAAAEELAARYPQSRLAESNFDLLRLRYAWLEQRFFDRWRWQNEPDSRARWPLELMRLATDIRAARAELNRNQPLPGVDGEQTPALSPAEANAKGRVSQFIFWEAWLSYFQATSIREGRGESARTAVAAFRELLDLPANQPVAELPPQWLDLQAQPWQWRAVLGLGLAYRCLGNDLESDWCFQQLSARDRGGESVLSSTYWNLCSYLWAEREDQAIQFLNQHLATPRSAAERRTWWLACLHTARMSGSTGQEAPLRLATAGCLGLIRDGHLEQLVEEYPPLAAADLRLGQSSVGAWATAVVAWQRAEQSGRVDEWREAETHYRQLVQQWLDQFSVDDQTLVRGQWALTLYQSRQWLQAVEQAELAAMQASKTHPERVPLLAWLAIQSRLAQLPQQPAGLPAVRAALLRLQQEFPNTVYAAKAELELLRLDQTTPAAATATQPPLTWSSDHPAYADGLLWRAAQIHRQVLHLLATKPKNLDATWQEQLDQLLQSYTEVQKEANNQAEKFSPAQRIKLEIWSIDVALRASESVVTGETAAVGSSNWWNRPGVWADLAESLANWRDQLPEQSPEAAESHYYEWLLAEKRGDTAGAGQHIQWLLVHAVETEYYGAALSHRANQAFQSWQSLPQDEMLQNQAIATHQTLRDWLQSHSVNQRADRLATINRRLAEWYLLQEKWSLADELITGLREQAAEDAGLLQMAARIKMRQQQLAAALPLWRRLVSGTADGSEAWLEAKLGVVQCLLEVEPQQALAVARQVLELYPEMPEDWQSKFRQVLNNRQDQ